MIYALPNRRPRLHPRSYVAPSAEVIGSVALGEHASVWFQAVLRGDNDFIHIGARANIQDGAVLHVDAGVPLTVGNDVTVGHGVMLHGCRIGDFSLLGIGSRVLNNAVLGEYCLVGANTLITEHKTFPPRSLIIGSPGKVVRALTESEMQQLRDNAAHYVAKIALYQKLQRL